MPFQNDGIPKINSYSLTDLHDFEDCSFRFFVRHHLDKKYEIDDGSRASALGNLLDQSIKKFHKHNFYDCKPEELVGLVRATAREIKELVEEASRKGKNHFYASTVPFLTEDVIIEAISIFQNYYKTREGSINKALDEVGFCQFVFEIDGTKYKLWGGPDTLEIGEDGVVEIVDYKSRQDVEKGKQYMDMDLMPKIYTLLLRQRLLEKGINKVRFKVRFWQDPMDETYFQEFDLSQMGKEEALVKEKISKILSSKEVIFCNRSFCVACKAPKKDEYISELVNLGLVPATSNLIDQF